MAFAEKSNVVYAAATLFWFGVYVAVVLAGAQHTPLVDVSYAAPMLLTIAGAIVVSIVGRVAVAVTWPRDVDKRDERDCQIAHLGDRVGNWVALIAGGAALFLAMATVDSFWIANTIYLGFTGSALLGSIIRAAAYRGAFQTW